MSVRNKLEGLINEITEKDASINEEWDLSKDVGLESIDIVELFVAIEKNFGVKMPESMFGVPKTIKSLTDYIVENKK